MTDWLISTLPPDAGPLLLGLVGSWGTSRPLLIVLFSCYVLAGAVVGYAVWRYFRR